MKIIFSIMGYFPDLVGGAWKYASGLAEALAERGHEVGVIVPQARPDLPLREELNGVHIRRLPRPSQPGGFMRTWVSDNRELKRVIESGELDPDALFINHQAYMGSGFRSWKGRAKASVFHGPWSEEFLLAKNISLQKFPRRQALKMAASWMHRVEEKAIRHAGHVLTASDYAGEKFRQTHPLAPVGSLTNIHAGTDYGMFNIPGEQLTQELRRRYQLTSDNFVVASVRRLDRRMGLDLLLEGFAMAFKKCPELRLVVAGKGPQAGELEARIDDLGLRGAATLAGFVSDGDLPAFYGMADLTVMPSLDLEGFGLSTIESMGCGTPVLASSSGANPEVAGGLSDELIFRSGDPADLAGKLLAASSGQLKLPGPDMCRQYALDHFHWHRSAEIVEAFAHEQFSITTPKTPVREAEIHQK
jgi:glycosyltransferase involved in cell wall biosynthesis